MSLDSIMLIAEVETTFNISISDPDKIFTIRDLSEYVVRHTGRELEEVEFTIMTILHESCGVEWKLLKPSARLASDLGID